MEKVYTWPEYMELIALRGVDYIQSSDKYKTKVPIDRATFYYVNDDKDEMDELATKIRNFIAVKYNKICGESAEMSVYRTKKDYIIFNIRAMNGSKMELKRRIKTFVQQKSEIKN